MVEESLIKALSEQAEALYKKPKHREAFMLGALYALDMRRDDGVDFERLVIDLCARYDEFTDYDGEIDEDSLDLWSAMLSDAIAPLLEEPETGRRTGMALHDTVARILFEYDDRRSDVSLEPVEDRIRLCNATHRCVVWLADVVGALSCPCGECDGDGRRRCLTEAHGMPVWARRR